MFIFLVILVMFVICLCVIIRVPNTHKVPIRHRNVRIFYYLANNESLSYTFDNELRMLLSSQPANTDIIASVGNRGQFQFTPSKGWVQMSTKSKDFHQFVNEIGNKLSSTCNIFWYGGHSDGYYLRPRDDLYVSAAEFGKSIQPYSLDLVVIDGCGSASMEFAYELKGNVNYLLGCVDYGSDEGLMTYKVLNETANHFDPVQIALTILRRCPYNENTSAYSLIDTRKVNIDFFKLFENAYQYRLIAPSYQLVYVPYEMVKECIIEAHDPQKVMNMSIISMISSKQDRNLFDQLRLAKYLKIDQFSL